MCDTINKYELVREKGSILEVYQHYDDDNNPLIPAIKYTPLSPPEGQTWKDLLKSIRECKSCKSCYQAGAEKCYSSRVVDGYIFDLDPSDAPLPAFTVDGSVVSGVTTPFVVEMQGVSTVTYNVDNGVTPADILAQVSSAGYTEVIFIAPDRIEVIHPTEQFVVVQVQGGTFVTSIGEERYVDVSGKATQYYQCGSDGLPDPATIQWRDSDTLESVSSADIVECEGSKYVTHTYAWCDESDPANVVPKITRYFSDGSEDVIDPPAGAKNPCNC